MKNSSNEKNKILHYYSMSLHIGGPAVYIKIILESSLNESYHLDVCYQEMAPKGVNLPLLIRMRNQIKAYKPDILHIHGLQSEGFYGVLAGRWAGCKKILMTVHGLASDTVEMSPFKKIIYRAIVEPITLRLADATYCVCEHMKNRPIIKNNAKHLLETIHTGIHLNNISRSRRVIRNELGIPNDKVLAIIASRIVKDKGYKELSEVIKYFYTKSENRLRFCIVGDGSFLSEIELNLSDEIAAGYLVLTGRRNDVNDLLLASDFFVFPSWHENLSIALLEAGRANLPCIATNVGGNPEIIIHNVNGLLVHPKRPSELVSAINIFLDNPKQRETMGENARRNISKNFSLNAMVDKINCVYQDLLT